jgi:hypothetical protein
VTCSTSPGATHHAGCDCHEARARHLLGEQEALALRYLARAERAERELDELGRVAKVDAELRERAVARLTAGLKKAADDMIAFAERTRLMFVASNEEIARLREALMRIAGPDNNNVGYHASIAIEALATRTAAAKRGEP